MGSRMRREVHVRFCERLAVTFCGLLSRCTALAIGKATFGLGCVRKSTNAARADALAGPDATNPALVDAGANRLPQSNAPRSLCVLRHCWEHTGIATGPSCRGTLLAQVEQPELARADLVEAIPADQGAVSVAATKGVSPLLGAASYRRAVKQLLTSIVREMSTLRSVGAGARATASGHPVGDQRWSSLPRQQFLI